MKEARHHIRYLGFETQPTGGRRLEYTITCSERPSRHAAVEIPVEVFTGPQHLTFQDAAIVGCEKLRFELEHEPDTDRSLELNLTLTLEDIVQFRPRRRAATKRP